MYRLILPAALAASLLPGTSVAETNDCTPITSLPATVTSQGIYCLTGDLDTAITTGAAIELNNNNITLDCNGYKVGGLAGGPDTMATGIRVIERSNITIRNCNVRGFLQGIGIFDSIAGGSGHVVEDNRLDGSTGRGIYVGGATSVIRRNQVTDTGGNPWDVSGLGIQAQGGTDVHDNTVDGVFEPSSSAAVSNGYSISASPGTAVTGNRARNIQSTVASRAYAYFGPPSNPGAVVFRGNFAASPLGTANSTSFYCPYPGTTLVVGNASVGFQTTYAGCVDGGGNTAVLPEP